MDKNIWFSRRALKLHTVILILVPAFMALCIWQITRAVDGNTLSWAYVFEWPIFAGYAVYMWWRFVHEAAESPPAASVQPASAQPASVPPASAEHAREQGEPDAGQRHGPSREEEVEEDAELAAYNRYLAQLAEHDRAADR